MRRRGVYPRCVRRVEGGVEVEEGPPKLVPGISPDKQRQARLLPQERWFTDSAGCWFYGKGFIVLFRVCLCCHYPRTRSKFLWAAACEACLIFYLRALTRAIACRCHHPRAGPSAEGSTAADLFLAAARISVSDLIDARVTLDPTATYPPI